MLLRKLQLSLILFTAVLLTGCAATNLKTFEQNRTCLTTLEGYYHNYSVLKVDYPCIFIKDKRGPVFMTGELKERDSSGVLFKKKAGGLYSNEPVYYPLDTLLAVVDTTGKAVYGEVPGKFLLGMHMNIELEDINHPNRTMLIMELDPDHSFSYCMQPGEYRIKQIIWENDKKDVMEGIDMPDITFTIDSGKVNYLGEMYIDKDKPGCPGTLSIPFKSWNRDNAAAAGWMFGIAGSLVYGLANSLEGAEAVKVISLETDENFRPEAALQIVPVSVHVKAAAEQKAAVGSKSE